MNNSFEYKVFLKIHENSAIILETFVDNSIKFPSNAIITSLSYSTAITLDLLFPNYNYGRFNIDFLLDLVTQQVEDSRKVIYDNIIHNTDFKDIFFSSQNTYSIEFFKNSKYTKEMLLADVNIFTEEFTLIKMNALLSTGKSMFDYNTFISFLVFPTITSLENYKERCDIIKAKLDSNTFFTNSKNNFKILFAEIRISLIKSHSEEDFFKAVKTFKNMPSAKTNNKNCYIATLVYEDIDHPKVMFLRKYRDEKLLTSLWGKLFTKLYYLVSPSFVKILRPYKNIQKFIRKILDMLIVKLSKQ